MEAIERPTLRPDEMAFGSHAEVNAVHVRVQKVVSTIYMYGRDAWILWKGRARDAICIGRRPNVS